jgi:hypothetical protein
VGIDTIRVRGPVAADALARLPRQRQRYDFDMGTGVRRVTATSSEDFTSTGIAWRVDQWRGRPEAVFEVSVPRVVRGDNRTPATVAEVFSVLRGFYNEAGRHVDWLCEPHDLGLLRVDCVRSFDGTGAPLGALLGALAKIAPERAQSCVYPNNEHTGVQTLERMTNRWRTRLYQRAEAYRNHARHLRAEAAGSLEALASADEGRLRFELELRSRALSDHGLHVLGDLEHSRLEQLAHRYFVRSRFDRRVGSQASCLAAAAAELKRDGRYKQLGPMLGLLTLQAAGLPPSHAAATTAKYKALAQELNVTASDLRAEPLPPMSLDWESGRVRNVQVPSRRHGKEG